VNMVTGVLSHRCYSESLSSQ